MNETQTILEEMVGRLLADRVDAPLLASMEAGIWPGRLWQAVEEQGLTRPLIPESMNGLGASWHDAFYIVRAAGRFRAPIPLPETIVASWLLALSELSVLPGPLTLAGRISGDVLELTRSGGQWRLSGTLALVPWGRAAAAVVVVLENDGEDVVVLAPVSGCRVVNGTNLAGEYRDTLTFEAHPVEVAPWPRGMWKPRIPVLGAMIRSAQIAGGLSAAVDLSVTYANDRQQFGRPIAKYQAVQQNLAVLVSEAVAADVAAEAVFAAADGRDPSFPAAVAKIRAGMAAGQGAPIAHQVHGAIGFAREYPLHSITRRLASWRAEFGGERQWSIRLGQQMVDDGAEGFWNTVTAQ